MVKLHTIRFIGLFFYANLLCTPVYCFSMEDKLLQEYKYLDQIANEEVTDKASFHHNYTEVYAEYFAPLRNKSIKFLEIGIGIGSSVRLWERYFPNAELHFIDIVPQSNNCYFPLRTQYHFLDQANEDALRRFVNIVGGEFDIIIDDGGHRMDQQINSFKVLFPQIKSGGLYIIEDLCTSYWTSHGGNGSLQTPLAGPGTALEFLKNLVEDVNHIGAATSCADWRKTPPDLWARLNTYEQNISSITFYSSLCIIKKR